MHSRNGAKRQPTVLACLLALALSLVAGLLSTKGSSIPGIELVSVLSVIAALHYFVAIRHYGILSPDGLFFVSQIVMMVGTLQLLDLSVEADSQYTAVVATGTISYIVASLLTFVIESRGRPRSFTYHVDATPPTHAFKFALMISVLVVVLYFSAVGYSAFLVGLEGKLNGQEADVASLRLDSYAGSRYLFPGYVNQFKNAVLPALSLVFATWAGSRSSFVVKAISWLLLFVSVIGLLWTGQRGSFVTLALTALVYSVLYNHRRVSKWALIVPLVSFPVMLMATLVLGRGDGAADGILDRFFRDNQASAIAGFRYTAERPTRWGGEWLDGMLGILPSNRGSTLSNEIFATMYGSTRGTAPPSLWGSVHYNWGIVGVLVIGVALGVVAQLWTSRSLTSNRYNTLQLAGISGCTVCFGTWIADGPIALLNVGFVAFLFLWFWGGRMARISKSETHRAKHVGAGSTGDRVPA